MRAVLVAAAMLLFGCGREGVDLLVRVEDRSCEAAKDEQECKDRAELGCVFQPRDEGCPSTDAACAPGVCREVEDAFVKVDGRGFSLGGKPFRFVGVSSWALLPTEGCTGPSSGEREAWITRAYQDLVASGTKVARFRALQRAVQSATRSGLDFTLLDASVRAARRAGVRLQLVLDDGKQDTMEQRKCPSLPLRDDAWYGGGYTKPEIDYPLSYKDYALAVADRYKDEPTVLGYIMLESTGGADPEILKTFVEKMGGDIKRVADKQLLSLDLVWTNTPSYADLQKLDVVDFIDIDDYYEPEPLPPELIKTLATIDKPAVVGEGAFRLYSEDPAGFMDRAGRAATRIGEWEKDGLGGALFWAYEPGWMGASEEFDFREIDPMLQPGGVVAEAPW
jgi:hypothetical protein